MRVLLLSLLLASPCQAQVFDPEPFAPWRLENQRLHVAAGAVLNVGMQLPILPKGMRDSFAKRLLLLGMIGVTWEVGEYAVARDLGATGQDGFGIGLADLACDVIGGLSVEVLRHFTFNQGVRKAHQR